MTIQLFQLGVAQLVLVVEIVENCLAFHRARHSWVVEDFFRRNVFGDPTQPSLKAYVFKSYRGVHVLSWVPWCGI
jgi:hypothetical protein